MSDSITIEDIIRFLEAEKEVYGPFSTDHGEDVLSEKDTQSGPETEEPSQEIPAQSVPVETKQPGISKPEVEAKPEPKEPTLEEKLAACTNLNQLKKLCAQADELKTDLEGTNLVFGTGNRDADLMLIGEAPGEQEDKQGEPFVGAAGQLLNKILKAIGFEREDVYIANILKHRPPGNRNPSQEEQTRSLPYLNRQIDLINPKVILCLGKVSGNTLLNRDEKLKNLRGTFYKYRGADLTVTYHPAALLRHPQWKRPTWEDVQKVKKRYDELGGTP
ncbi:MAG: uracil-DNA glycosylase [Balneolaceae bacterium]|nr:uracil-DNA glycosylase [Balneolaceae bacterium]MCH8548391.1 uracil-DNA glycosylase [Balneolaceae bacterium]